VRLLVLAPSYPHSGHSFSGLFNERCVAALSKLCETVEVVVPRPFCPPGLSRLSPRWKTYSDMPGKEIRGGVPIWRPAQIQIPSIGGPLWLDRGSFLCVAREVRAMHRRVDFDAILSFDLLGTGGLAWRLGRDLGIPAAGYATGDDVKVAPLSSWGKMLTNVVRRLDLVFYQSRELLERVASLLETDEAALESAGHMVLPRGIPPAPALDRAEVRTRVRRELGIAEDRVLVLSVGRFVRDKGIYELLDALSAAGKNNPRIASVLVGGKPGFDEERAIELKLASEPELARSIRLLPAVTPERIWELLCAADLFAFPSHREGMPNSLLEAMAMGVPSVAFAIPPVLEIAAGKGAPVIVPLLDSGTFAEALLRLASSAEERRRTSEAGRAIVLERFSVSKNMAVALGRLAAVASSRRRPSLAPAHRSVG